MYSTIKNVQILIALLKKYGYSDVVISPGGNNIPIIHSMDTDPFFNCYSVVDERSAGYFAMGLSQQFEKPVVMVCTSGTAVSNYLPAVTEAYYQRVPLIVITSDRSPYLLDQMETQKIDQTNIFHAVIKKEVTLPVIKDDNDEWYCNRLINEALIELVNHGEGPVHINVPTTGNPMDYSCQILPDVTKIEFIRERDIDVKLKELVDKLNKKKVLLVFGENFRISDELEKLVDDFVKVTGVVAIRDYLSNININNSILSYRITESYGESDFLSLLPDIVITFNNNFLSNNLKNFIRYNRKNVSHWCVDEAGVVRDVFKSLDTLIECDNLTFFKCINKYIGNIKADKSYIDAWKKAENMTVISEIPYSDLDAVRQFVADLPNNTIVHTAILNSTRAFHLFLTDKKIKVYSNIGALGIDGCMSTFIGHSFATENYCFLIIGDLSFFYDMNSLGIRGIKNNVRILLLNNGGGAEFHFNMGIKTVPTLNEYISVKHSKVARAWAESMNFRYIKCENHEQLVEGMKEFTSFSQNPILFEVFTDMENDASVVQKILAEIKGSRSSKSMLKQTVKKLIGM